MPVTIRGVDELIAKLGNAVAVETLYPPMQRAVFGLQAGMAQYPPELPNQVYRRTGTLGRTWTTSVEETGNGLQGRVGNVTQYAPAVQGAETQTAPFVGRWQTDQSELERQLPMIVADFEDAISRALEGQR